MSVIELTRQLGAEIQKEEAYKKFHEAMAKNDRDDELNKLIGEFNLYRVSLENEAGKEDRNDQKVEEINNQLRECYTKIMANENMKTFEEAKAELDKLMNKINGILSLCIEGEDPATCEVSEGCGSSCSDCESGCHH